MKTACTLAFVFVLFCANSDAAVNDIVVEDKGKFSRVTVHIDKERRYKLTRSGDSDLILLVDDNSRIYKTKGRQKSRLVKRVSPHESPSGKTSLKISLNGKLLNFTDFFLKSPARIVINMEAKVDASPVQKQAKPVVNKRANKKKAPVKKPSPPETVKPEKKSPAKIDRSPPAANTQKSLSGLEGFEDLVMPSLTPFVEIFDTEEPLSIYYVNFPEGELLDYPEKERIFGHYKLKNPHLINAVRNLTEGDYKRAIWNINRAESKVGNSEDYRFLMADARYMQSLSEGGMNESLKLYEEAAELFPLSKNAPWALLQAGKGMLDLGLYTEAQNYFEKLLENYKGHAHTAFAKMGLAKSLSKLHKREQALSLYKDFIENHADSPYMVAAVYGAAENMAFLGRHRRAQFFFDKAMKRWPGYHLRDPETLMMMGESHYYMMKYDVAMENFLRLVNLYPDDKQANRAMARVGDIYLRQGKEDAANRMFAEVEKKYPGSDGAHVGKIRMADILASRGGEKDKVMALYEGVYSKYLENPLAQVSIIKAGMFLRSRKELREAFDLLRDFERLYPKSRLKGFVFKEMIKAYSELIAKHNEEADCLEVIRLIDKFPRFFSVTQDRDELVMMKGACLYRYAQFDKAIKVFGSVSKEGPREKAMLMTAMSFYEKGDMDATINKIDDLYNSYPKSKGGKNTTLLLANSYFKKKDFKRAIPHYKGYLSMEKLAPERADAAVLLGDAIRLTGDPAAAAAVYRDAIRDYMPDNNEKLSATYFVLGETLYNSGDCPGAVDAYKNAQNYSAESRFREAAYKAAVCHDKAGNISQAVSELKPVSEDATSAFWSGLSEGTMSDILWQDAHDRP